MSKLTIKSKVPGSYSPMALEIFVDDVRIGGVQSLTLEIAEKKLPKVAIIFTPREIEVDHKALIDFVARLKDQSTPEQVDDIEKGRPVTYGEDNFGPFTREGPAADFSPFTREGAAVACDSLYQRKDESPDKE